MTTPPVPSDDRQFPHLTEMQEAYVVEFATNGGMGEAAAIAAGYSADSARTLSSRMLRNPRIAQAILEVTALRLASHAPGAVETIHRLSRTSKSDYVKLEASKDILNRVGATAPQRVAVSGGVSITIDLA